MFDEVAARQASLVAEWLRVGYCQGNLNSDNSALGGVTLDYGPFAFMERFNLLYNPWVGGGLPYSFAKQPQALATNLVGLAQAFLALVEQVAKAEGRSEKDINALSERVRGAVSSTFVDTFNARHDENCRAKLGLSKWDDEADALFTEHGGGRNGLYPLLPSARHGVRGGGGCSYLCFRRRGRLRRCCRDGAARERRWRQCAPAAQTVASDCH